MTTYAFRDRYSEADLGRFDVPTLPVGSLARRLRQPFAAYMKVSILDAENEIRVDAPWMVRVLVEDGTILPAAA